MLFARVDAYLLNPHRLMHTLAKHTKVLGAADRCFHASFALAGGGFIGH